MSVIVRAHKVNTRDALDAVREVHICFNLCAIIDETYTKDYVTIKYS